MLNQKLLFQLQKIAVIKSCIKSNSLDMVWSEAEVKLVWIFGVVFDKGKNKWENMKFLFTEALRSARLL